MVNGWNNGQGMCDKDGTMDVTRRQRGYNWTMIVLCTGWHNGWYNGLEYNGIMDGTMDRDNEQMDGTMDGTMDRNNEQMDGITDGTRDRDNEQMDGTMDVITSEIVDN